MEEEFTLVGDNEGHTYLIPFSKNEEWNEFMDSQDYRDGVEPDYAERVEGEQLVFTCPRKMKKISKRSSIKKKSHCLLGGAQGLIL